MIYHLAFQNSFACNSCTCITWSHSTSQHAHMETALQLRNSHLIWAIVMLMMALFPGGSKVHCVCCTVSRVCVHMCLCTNRLLVQMR